MVWDDPNFFGAQIGEDQTLFTIEFEVIGDGGSATPVAVVNGLTPIELSISGKNAATESSPGLVAVQASLPGTLGVVTLESNQLTVWYEAPPGSLWVIQASPDFTHRTQVGQPAPAPQDAIATVALPVGSDRQYYYRAWRLQQPFAFPVRGAARTAMACPSFAPPSSSSIFIHLSQNCLTDLWGQSSF